METINIEKPKNMFTQLFIFIGHKPIYGFLTSVFTFMSGWVPPIDETMQHFGLFIFQMLAFLSTVVVAVFTVCSIIHRWNDKIKKKKYDREKDIK